MTIRIGDVAARAGVSITTVSLVLNGVQGARVAEETRQRVLAATRELGYVPNALARGLRTRRTHTIGLISDNISITPYAGRMIQGAQEAAWEAGFVLILVETGGNARLEREAVAALGHRQVDGVIFACMYHQIVDRLPKGLRDRRVVVLDAEIRDRSVAAVVPDEEEGGYLATRRLIEAGHRRIGHTSDDADPPAAGGRLAGYHRALVEAGVPTDPDLLAHGRSDSHGGEAAARRLLAVRPRPTALFCYNDRMAMGAYRAARAENLAIPVDLSIIGFDDQELVAAELSPGLTTVALPHYAMGYWAARELARLIARPDKPFPAELGPDRTWLEPCPLVERESVGPPPRSGNSATADLLTNDR